MASTRITSSAIYIEFLPQSLVPAEHVEIMAMEAAIDGGDFKLWVNGETTATIAYNVTIGTLITNINTALDALPNLSASDIVAAATVQTAITFTASGIGNGYVRIKVRDDSLTKTVPNSNENLTFSITTQGSDWIRVSDEASALDWEASTDTVDVTAISEYHRTHRGVAENVSGTISLYKPVVDNQVIEISLAMVAGNTGVLRYFPEGKIVGKEVMSMDIIIETFSEDFPDHEKVEQEVSFMRLGEWIDWPRSIWRG